jgi:hypothetical protein
MRSLKRDVDARRGDGRDRPMNLFVPDKLTGRIVNTQANKHILADILLGKLLIKRWFGVIIRGHCVIVHRAQEQGDPFLLKPRFIPDERAIERRRLRFWQEWVITNGMPPAGGESRGMWRIARICLERRTTETLRLCDPPERSLPRRQRSPLLDYIQAPNPHLI